MYRRENGGLLWRIGKKYFNTVYHFPDTYVEAPFHDANWQLVRVKGSKKRSYGHMKRMVS